MNTYISQVAGIKWLVEKGLDYMNDIDYSDNLSIWLTKH